jgi:2'-5' RNA ligase
MKKAKDSYAIVLTFSEDIENVFSKMRSRFQQYLDYTIVPHITLVYPFAPVFTLLQINEQLDKIAKHTRQFSITLNKIKYFEKENKVVYAALQNRQPVKKLHTDIVKSLDGLVKEIDTDGRYNLENYVPHVTIGSHLPDRVFKNVKNRFARYRIRYVDKITYFSLFAEENGDWERVRVFNLSS